MQNQTLDISSISSGWASYTADDFYYKINSVTGAGSGGSAGGTVFPYYTAPAITYDNTSGLLTLNNGEGGYQASQIGSGKRYPTSITVVVCKNTP